MWAMSWVARHGGAAGWVSVAGYKAGPVVWYASRNSGELLPLSRPAGIDQYLYFADCERAHPEFL